MSKPRVIALYLPQFHPIPENDIWWGKGFTEWTNVAKTKPLFPAHYQPKIPADLGFYDLRVLDVMKQQVELAKESGIEGFCFYHYWCGNGKTLLEKPIENFFNNKDLNLPFCLCWANHDWMKQDWNAAVSRMDKTMLMKQEYPGDADILAHFNYCLPYFKDERYIKINGKPAFFIYNVCDIPDFEAFCNKWNNFAKENGFPGIYFVGYRHQTAENLNAGAYSKCNGNAIEMLLDIKYGSTKKARFFSKIKRGFDRLLGLPEFLFDYRKIYKRLVTDEVKQTNIFPVLVPNFDHSPRRGKRGIILTNSTPEYFRKHLIDVFEKVKNKDSEENIVLLKSWNEWGEGNYVEPDLKYGKGYITALKESLELYK